MTKKNLELVASKRKRYGTKHSDYYLKNHTWKGAEITPVKDCEGCKEEINLAVQYSKNQDYEVILEVKGIHLFLKVKELIVD